MPRPINHPLEITSITKSFGKKKVLNAISLGVRKGDIYGLIGLNGAGKTTLIKIILGLLKADSGSALVQKQSAILAETRRNICFLPEKFHPPQLLYGHEFLKLCLSYYTKPYDAAKAVSMLESLDLDPAALNLKVAKYSKGMGQKLGIASAFLSEAPVLILDEPMSGLDPRARIHLKDTMLAYAASGKTIFFSSHVLSDMDEICNRIAIMHEGEIRFEGTPVSFRKKHKDQNLERSFLSAIS